MIVNSLVLVAKQSCSEPWVVLVPLPLRVNNAALLTLDDWSSGNAEDLLALLKQFACFNFGTEGLILKGPNANRIDRERGGENLILFVQRLTLKDLVGSYYSVCEEG
jgi:hypothetical protein